MFRFASPYFFFLLLLIPAAVYFRKKKRMDPVLKVTDAAGIKAVSGSPVLHLRWVVPFLKYTALVLLVFALARPQWGTRQTQILTEGVNIVIAVDVSGSMMALDFRKDAKIVDRLEAIKGVVEDFVSRRNGDRIGLVIFGDAAYTQLPLTRDYNGFSSILKRIRIGAAGNRTAIGDAIGISLKRLEDIESKSNIIILLTDGESNAGEISPSTAAEIAAEKKVKIYTIGVGTRGRAPYLINGRYITQQVSIDEDTLKQIAEKTGGLYFRAENTEGLEKIYETIDKLEKTEVKVKTYADYNELYPYLVIPALILVSIWIILVNTRFLRVP